MPELLNVDKLSGGYHSKIIVKDVSLGIHRGDFLGIIGPNGSGKTTLLRLISRILIPANGKISLDGADAFSLSLKEFCRKIAFVSQDLEVAFTFTVLEFVLMGRIPHLRRLQSESKKDFSIAMDSLSMTDTLHLKDRQINELSAGERQRIMIARALTQQPILLLLDEPTSHLDIGHQIQILDLLRKLNINSELTIAMVIHDLNLAGLYCNRIILLNEGKVFTQGSSKEVLTYQNIEAVYKTVVVVKENPITKRPHVFLVPKEKQDDN